MIVDGKKIAAEILARAKARAEQLPRRPKVVALVGLETPATRSYLKIKAARAADAGCDFATRLFPADFSDAEAVIIQLPLPDTAVVQEALDSIPLAKDADILSTAAREKFENGEEGALLPPVVGAIAEIFDRYGLDPRGKCAVVIGRGFLVGAPAASWLLARGAKVTVLTKEAKLGHEVQEADLVIAGTGVPHLIKPYMLKEGVVLIDAGTSESAGVLAGDAEPSCSTKCSLFTPVPGGVGPIAVAKLFENAVILAERSL